MVIYVVYCKQYKNENPHLNLSLYTCETVLQYWIPRNRLPRSKNIYIWIFSFSCVRISRSFSCSGRIWSRNQLAGLLWLGFPLISSPGIGSSLHTSHCIISKWTCRGKANWAVNCLSSGKYLTTKLLVILSNKWCHCWLSLLLSK